MTYLCFIAGIYLHIPFCSKACHYCDFHFSTTRANYDQILDALREELVHRKGELSTPIETIYFGGGTPSLLDIKDVQLLLSTIHEHYETSTLQEVTFEINPEDANPKYLESLLELGISRLSIGVQTFKPEILKWMNRAHSAMDAINCLQSVRSVGFDNFSCDLIFGTKQHNIELINEDIERLLSFDTPHISTYSLTIEPATAFSKFEQNGQVLLSDDDAVLDQMNHITNVLSEKGIRRYEVSNYAIEGAISLHNSSYWNNKPYLGIGPSAHSYSGSSRQINVSHNQKYIAGVQNGTSYFEIEKLKDTDLVNEHLLTRLRTIWGVDLNYIQNVDGNFLSTKKHTIDTLITEKKLYIENDHLFTTTKGMELLDSITEDLFI